MSLVECYKLIGGDYDEIINALGSEGIISKFLLKLLNEPTSLLLAKSLEEKNYSEAFRAAHTIKGICLNLSLKRLFSYVGPLTEALRNLDNLNLELVNRLYKEFKLEYDKEILAIKQYKDGI